MRILERKISYAGNVQPDKEYALMCEVVRSRPSVNNPKVSDIYIVNKCRFDYIDNPLDTKMLS